MESNALQVLRQMEGKWVRPRVPGEIPQGDMPGDQIHIGETHIAKAEIIFPELLKALPEAFVENPHRRAVVAVCGGSGVGKSEIASLLSFYLREMGIGSYTLSGDNYPRRIPEYNDAERLRIFRSGGLRGLVSHGQCVPAQQEALREWQREQQDADPALAKRHPWLAIYQREGRKALAGYLGATEEIDFDEMTGIVAQFKNGANHIPLKRMGRALAEVWYEDVDFSNVQVLMIEWTHGNSDHFQGVDIPILLNSTPQETLAHRRARNRDGNADSPFTSMVLELEQKQLEMQAAQAKIIVAKSGELLSYQAYRRLMADETQTTKQGE